MNACLLPILAAIFGAFLFFGVAQTDVEMGSDSAPSVQVEEAQVEVGEAVAVSSASYNAELYIYAIAANDAETAANYVCADNAEELLEGYGEAFEVMDLVCTDEDDSVNCTFTSDLGLLDEATEVEMSFATDENGLVCEILEVQIDGEVGAPE